MADRYWVGGTASWDGTAGTKWATTSGGAGGASVPTTADAVFFSALSTGTCTIATGNTGALSINCTGFTGTITGTADITVAGSVTLVAGMAYTHTGTVTLTGTGTLTTAAKTFSGVTVDGSGITVTLGGALNMGNRNLTITQGTFVTANFQVIADDLISNNSNVRTITLGSSQLSLSGTNGINFANSTNLTFNANTSVINIFGTNASFSGGGNTFYNAVFNGAFNGSRSITDANTFNNLTIQSTAFGLVQLVLFANQTVNGTFSCTGFSATQRYFFRSNTPGTARTITAAAASISDCDFRDITIAGAAAPVSTTRGGDCGGNSGITFPAAKTVYKISGGPSDWNYPASWALSSGGTGSNANFPLAQDTAIIDNNSTSTVTIQEYNIGALNCSSRSVALTLNYTSSALWYGSHTFSSSITVSGTETQTFFGRGTMVFTSAGRTLTFQFQINGAGGTFQLGDAMNTGTASITVVRGTFNTANFALTAGSLLSTNTTVRTITLGSSTVTLSGNVDFTDPTNLTFNGGTSQINLSAAGSQVLGGSQTFYNVSFTSTAVGTRLITGANTFNNLTLTASGTGLTQLQISGDQTVNGTFTCTGSSAIARGFIRSNTVGSTRTLTCAAGSITNCDFRDITIAGAVAPISVTGGGDCGGNSGITFPAAKTVYWNLAGTQNWNATGWATTSAGTPNVNNFPLAQDTATFTNSGAAGTVAFGLIYNAGTIDASARTSAMTLNHNIAFSIHGSYILGSGVTVSGTTGQSFSGAGTQTFTSAGKTITFPITVDKFAGAFELGDAFTASNTITHTRGTLDGKIYNLTCTTFNSSNSNARTISMGSGLWTLTATGTIWNTATTTNLTFNKDTANILLSNTTTTARAFNGGGLSYNKLTIGGATGISVTALSGASSFTELASIKTVAHTVRLASNLGTIDTWSITGTVGNVVTVESNTAGTRRTFNLTNVTAGINYLSVKDIGVNQASRFYVGVNSTDGGNNSNVIFTAAPPVTQTLTPALFTNTNTFYLTTITQTGPPQSLLPDLYINPNTIYAATLTASNELAPARYDNTNVFYAPTVTQAGALQTLAPALYINPNTIYAATVTGNNTLTPARYNNTNVFYSAVVSQAGAPQTLTPALYTNPNTFYAATVTASNTLAPARYNNTNVFYSASISRGAVTLTPARYNNTNVFYSASISRGAVTIAPNRYNNVNVIFAANVLAVNTVTPARYNNSNVFYSAVIVQTDPKIEPPLTVNANIFFGAYLISFPPANFKPPWSRQPMPPPEEQPREAFQVTQTPREPLVVTENPRQSFQESSTPRQSFQESSTPRQSFNFSA